MITDPYQMNNLWGTMGKISGLKGYGKEAVMKRLDALMLVAKTCKGKSCRKPWEELHPDGSVQSLNDAMDEKYLGYYEGLPKVGFEGCGLGYIEALEGVVWDESLACKGCANVSTGGQR
jgi:hypothetical protein